MCAQFALFVSSGFTLRISTFCGHLSSNNNYYVTHFTSTSTDSRSRLHQKLFVMCSDHDKGPSSKKKPGPRKVRSDFSSIRKSKAQRNEDSSLSAQTETNKSLKKNSKQSDGFHLDVDEKSLSENREKAVDSSTGGRNVENFMSSLVRKMGEPKVNFSASWESGDEDAEYESSAVDERDKIKALPVQMLIEQSENSLNNILEQVKEKLTDEQNHKLAKELEEIDRLFSGENEFSIQNTFELKNELEKYAVKSKFGGNFKYLDNKEEDEEEIYLNHSEENSKDMEKQEDRYKTKTGKRESMVRNSSFSNPENEALEMLNILTSLKDIKTGRSDPDFGSILGDKMKTYFLENKGLESSSRPEFYHDYVRPISNIDYNTADGPSMTDQHQNVVSWNIAKKQGDVSGLIDEYKGPRCHICKQRVYEPKQTLGFCRTCHIDFHTISSVRSEDGKKFSVSLPLWKNEKSIYSQVHKLTLELENKKDGVKNIMESPAPHAIKYLVLNNLYDQIPTFLKMFQEGLEKIKESDENERIGDPTPFVGVAEPVSAWEKEAQQAIMSLSLKNKNVLKCDICNLNVYEPEEYLGFCSICYSDLKLGGANMGVSGGQSRYPLWKDSVLLRQLIDTTREKMNRNERVSVPHAIESLIRYDRVDRLDEFLERFALEAEKKMSKDVDVPTGPSAEFSRRISESVGSLRETAKRVSSREDRKASRVSTDGRSWNNNWQDTVSEKADDDDWTRKDGWNLKASKRSQYRPTYKLDVWEENELPETESTDSIVYVDYSEKKQRLDNIDSFIEVYGDIDGTEDKYSEQEMMMKQEVLRRHQIKEDCRVFFSKGSISGAMEIVLSSLSDGHYEQIASVERLSHILVPRMHGREIHLAAMYSGVAIVEYEMYFDEKSHGLRIDIEDVKSKISASTVIIYVSNPNEISCSAVAERDISALFEIAEREFVPLLVNESYREFVDGKDRNSKYYSFAKVDYQMYQVPVFIIGEVFGGFNIGYILACDRSKLLERTGIIRGLGQLCNKIERQEIVKPFLKPRVDRRRRDLVGSNVVGRKKLQEVRTEITEGSQRVENLLDQSLGQCRFEFPVFGPGFLVRIDKMQLGVETDVEFAEKLWIEKALRVTPGSMLGVPGASVWVSLLGGPQRIKEICIRMNDFMRSRMGTI